FFQAEDGIRDRNVTGVQTCALPICAGVVRATIYMHFPTRESLLDAVMEEATGRVAEAIRQAEPDRGVPREALERVILATWRQLKIGRASCRERGEGSVECGAVEEKR